MTGNGPAGGPAVPPLDPGLLRVIRGSAAQLQGAEDEFAQQLQYDLATLIPDLAGLRTEDGWVFCARLIQALLWAATADQPAARIAEAMRQLGAMNWREGFPETQYVSVAHALVRAVRDLSGYEWSTSDGSAWISFFQWVKPHLVAGAQQAAAQQAAPVASSGPAQPPATAPPAHAPPTPGRATAPSAGPPTAAANSATPPAAPGAGASGPGPTDPGSEPSSGGAPTGSGWPPAPPRDLRVARPQRPAAQDELEAAAGLLEEDEEDTGPGYGQIMVSMTTPRRPRPPRSG